MGRLDNLERQFTARMQQALNRGDALACACGREQNAADGMKIINGKPICKECRTTHAFEQERKRREDRQQQIQMERRLLTQMTVSQMFHGAQGSNRLVNMAVLGKLLGECPSFPPGPEGAKNILRLAEGAFDKEKVLDELYEALVTNGILKPYPEPEPRGRHRGRKERR